MNDTFTHHWLQIHSEDSQYEDRQHDGANWLKFNAIPTVFDVPNPPPSATVLRKHARTKMFICSSAQLRPCSVMDRPLPSAGTSTAADHTHAQSAATAATPRWTNNAEHSYG